MKLNTELVLLSLKMILTGFVAEFAKSRLLCLVFSQTRKPLYLMFFLERILFKAKISFESAQRAYTILLHHKKGLLRLQ